MVENKRLGSVLAHIQQQHEELEKQNKRSRSKKSMPSRKAQKAVIEQRNLILCLTLAVKNREILNGLSHRHSELVNNKEY